MGPEAGSTDQQRDHPRQATDVSPGEENEAGGDKNREEQLAMLRHQLDLAVELDLPVIVNCRDAAQPMLGERAARAVVS